MAMATVPPRLSLDFPTLELLRRVQLKRAGGMVLFVFVVKHRALVRKYVAREEEQR
jgi:hypothetical protein